MVALTMKRTVAMEPPWSIPTNRQGRPPTATMSRSGATNLSLGLGFPRDGVARQRRRRLREVVARDVEVDVVAGLGLEGDLARPREHDRIDLLEPLHEPGHLGRDHG